LRDYSDWVSELYFNMTNWKLERIAVALLSPVFVLPIGASAQTATPHDAMALEQQGNLAEAAKVWRAVIQKDPSDAAALASLGVILSKEQKYQEAASAYQKAIALNPKLPGVELNWGLAEFKQGHFQAAIPPLHAALVADPHNLQASTLLGLSYYGAKSFREAIQYLEAPAESDPSNSELQEVLAQSCLFAKKYSCALDSFQEILRQNPDSAAAHMLSGEAFDGLERTEEAIAEFEAAAAVSPREPNVHFGLGYLHWKSHQ
jgi:tetratricopeptide (TPR) repeat protein